MIVCKEFIQNGGITTRAEFKNRIKKSIWGKCPAS
jgi:hypothetical protein